jgi:hypothetical protein
MAGHHPELEPRLSSGPRPWARFVNPGDGLPSEWREDGVHQNDAEHEAGEEERGRSMVTGELRPAMPTCHLPRWIDPDTMRCEHPEHD